MPPDDPGVVAEAFDEIRRFHVYDHERDEWVMSGADFGGDAGCALEHNYEPGELHRFDRPETVVAESEELTLVWEDGDRADVEESVVGLETAEIAARAVIDGLSDRLGVEPERIRVISLEAPNQVRYFLTGPSMDEVADE